jgi:hypothetical protein
MQNLIRIIVVVLCALALYYLVITLARSVDDEEVGLHTAAHGVELAARTQRSPAPGAGAAHGALARR